MHKLVCAAAAVLLMAGLSVAADVVVVSYDKEKKEVKVKDGDAEKVYKITDKTKVMVTDKDGKATEGKVEDLTRRLEATGKGGGGKGRQTKLTITTDGDTLTEVKYRARGKKN